MSRRHAAVWLTLLCFSIPRGAFAQVDPEVDARFKRGVEFYRDYDYKSALVEFKRAYQKSDNPKILYNLAQCEYQLNNYVGALAYFEQYLRDGGDDVDPERRENVARDIAQVRSFTATLTVSVDVEGATIFVDDETYVSPLSEAIRVNPGVHRIAVAKEGYLEAARTIEVAGGDFPAVQLSLLPRPAEERPKAVVAADVGGSEHDGEVGDGQRAAGLIAGGAGVVGLGIGAAFGLVAMSKNGDVKAMCTIPACPDARGPALADEARSAATVSTIGFVAGGALLAGGVALYLTAPKREPRARGGGLHLSPEVGRRMAGVTLGGRF